MSNKDGGFGRLWSGREQDHGADEKILPLKPPHETAQGGQHERSYVAFEVRDRAERLHILRAAGPSRFPSYHYLLDISFDHHLQSGFILIYTFMIVEVTGCDLGPVVHALNFGNCERIREYSPKLFDAPTSGRPLIQKISITTADEKLMNPAAEMPRGNRL